MATWADVSAIAARLPGAEPGESWGEPVWRVGRKGFAWVRPLRAKDRAELGESAPSGAIIGLSVADEHEKRALLAEDPRVFFTTSHFDGYPAVLVVLDAIDASRLRDIVTDAWFARAPKRLRDAVGPSEA